MHTALTCKGHATNTEFSSIPFHGCADATALSVTLKDLILVLTARSYDCCVSLVCLFEKTYYFYAVFGVRLLLAWRYAIIWRQVNVPLQLLASRCTVLRLGGALVRGTASLGLGLGWSVVGTFKLHSIRLGGGSFIMVELCG